MSNMLHLSATKKKVDDRELFKPGTLDFICHQFELPQNK